MANKQKIKGAEALLLSLIAEGTDTIFGYPGGQVIPIYDHLYHHTDRLHHILTRHEQGAVHAAQGYAVRQARWASVWPPPVPARRISSPE